MQTCFVIEPNSSSHSDGLLLFHLMRVLEVHRMLLNSLNSRLDLLSVILIYVFRQLLLPIIKPITT